MHSSYFVLKNKEGKQAEQLVKDYLTDRGYTVQDVSEEQDNYQNDIDFIVQKDGRTSKIEVKLDKRLAETQNIGIPFYRGTEIGALAEKKAVIPALFITEEHYKQLCETTGKPQKGDLLMPSICPDGRIWIVDTDEPFYFKDGRVLWVHLTSANYNSVFLLYTLKDRIMTDYASIASGTTFAELKIFALKKCKVFDVPLELQNQFATFIERVDRQKQTVQQSLEKLELMKKALMQEYFG